MLTKTPLLLFLNHIKLKNLTKYFLVIIFLSLIISVFAAQTPADRRKELETKRKQLQESIRKNKNELIKVKAEAFNKEKELKILAEQIENREQVINVVGQQAFELTLQIGNQKELVTKLRQDVVLLKQDYANFLVAAYKRRLNSADLLFFVFEAKDLQQAMRRLRYLNAYGTYRQKQAQLILNTQRQMIALISEMITVKQEKAFLIKEKETEKKALVQDKQEEQKLLTQLQGKEKDLKQKIEKQMLAAKKLSKEIELQIAREIEAARKAEEKKRAAAQKANKPSVPKTSTSYLSDADIKLGLDFSSSKGKLPWPVSGKVIETFGDHAHPTLKGVVTTNNGIEILSKPNAEVKAVYKGVVKAIFPIPGLDKVVLVSHGEYYTVYARLAKVSIKIGESIETGKVIGSLAVHQDSGEGRLHFEVWKQRVFQNPLPWLRVK